MIGQQLEVRVRRARLEDARRLAELSGHLSYPAKTAAIRRRLRSLLRSGDHAVYAAEISNGQVIGWIHAFVHRVLERECRVEIGGLVVAEGLRGRGAGQLLLERAERWAKRKRMRSLYLRSNITRKKSHRFYQKRGYRIIKMQYAFLKNL
jgi:GNAT superfamily N-acetyltransferase